MHSNGQLLSWPPPFGVFFFRGQLTLTLHHPAPLTRLGVFAAFSTCPAHRLCTCLAAVADRPSPAPAGGS